MNVKHFFKDKFIYILIGGFITGGFNYHYNIKLLKKANSYKDRMAKQEFVLELSHLLQKRMYNAKVFFWNIEGNAYEETILESWEKYKETTIEWNENLSNIYILLDIYFPKEKYLINEYSPHFIDKLSFREFLFQEIQLKTIQLHKKLIELKKKTKLPNCEMKNILLKTYTYNLDKELDELHNIATNYIEALKELVKKNYI